MRSIRPIPTVFALLCLTTTISWAQGRNGGGNQTADPVRPLVAALTLDQYKATIKGLAQFGDRRQGTKRNRDALDWIEAQLKSYGCSNTERITYQYTQTQLRRPAVGTPPARGNTAADTAGRGAAGGRNANAGGTGRGNAAGTGRGNAGGNGRGQTDANAPGNAAAAAAAADTMNLSVAEIMRRGIAAVAANPPTRYVPRAPTGVNIDSLKQPDARIRALDAEPDEPGQRQDVYCTKVGTKHPDEMYIVAGHMDGHGFNEAVNDDGSGTALVMELARVFSQPGVVTDRSIRFVLWNNEETGLNGSKAYADQRAPLQGKESPAGSGKYPEPKWLGMIQHDMMMWDHGAPDSAGNVSPVPRKEADVNIEFSATAKMANEAMQLAWFFRSANEKYADTYPAAVGYRMSNTDSESFKDLTAAISLRENERVPHTRDGWNPTWHQPTDVWTTFSDKDFRLGLNAAQTTLGAVAQLVNARVKQ